MTRSLLALSLAAASVCAQFGPSGPAAAFLTITPDARTAALGGVGVALDSLDGNTYYNPANITCGSPMTSSWTHIHWLPSLIAGASIDHAGLVYRPNERVGFAASLQYLQLGLIEVTNERGEFIGAYRWYDVAPSVSAAYRVMPALSAGLTTKAVYSFVAPAWAWPGAERNRDALTFACDAGIQYRPLSALTLGLSVANLGPNMSYDTTEGGFLPRIARLGFAARPPIPGPISATLAGEVSRNLYPAGSSPDPWHLGAGLELGVAHLAFVRFGYRYDHSLKGLTWGVGLERRGIRIDVGVDSDIYEQALGNQSVRFQFSWHL
jgi:hypothetical protein